MALPGRHHRYGEYGGRSQNTFINSLLLFIFGPMQLEIGNAGASPHRGNSRVIVRRAPQPSGPPSGFSAQ